MKDPQPEVHSGEKGKGNDVSPPLVSSSEAVWLLAGRTGESYAALCNAISKTGGDDGGMRDDCLAHLVTIGPTAAGGEAAAIGRLKR